MKKIKNIKINKKFFSSKKAKSIFLASVITITPMSLGCGVYLHSQLNKNLSYYFNGQHFSSYKSLMDYVNTNTNVKTLEGNNSKWTIEYNNEVKTYSDPNLLRQDVYKNFITTKDVKTDVDLEQYATKNGIIGLTDPSVWNHISFDTNDNQTVYLGNNDVAFTNKEDAYKSYFINNHGYYYNSIYFKNKDDLKSYLTNDYFPSNPVKNNTIVLKAPNGNSIAIDLSKNNAQQLLSKFVNDNAMVSLTYRTNNDVLNINKENLSQVIDQVQINDLNHFKMYANQGESRYVIDNKYIDNANLIGPYFYNGVLDVSSFMNKSMWKKVNNVPDKVYLSSKIDKTIGSFFSSIINDDTLLNSYQAKMNDSKPTLFRTLLETNEKTSYDVWFLNELERLSPELYKAVMDASEQLISGKKYNSFFKIPILYSFLMQRAISWNLSQEVINLIVDYFTNVCNFIQDVLETVSLNDEQLLVDINGKTKFDVASFFEIGNPQYDLNTSTEYFLNELKHQYPSVAGLAITYTMAQYNINMASGLIPFKAVDFSEILNNGIIPPSSLVKIKNSLNNVYDTFSQLNINDMAKNFVKYNKNQVIANLNKHQDIEIIKKELESISTEKTNTSILVLLTGFGLKNNEYYSVANATLEFEIKAYLETSAIISGGYLDKLRNANINSNYVAKFINYVKANALKVSPFQIYLIFLLDAQHNLNYFNDPSLINNHAEFARRLSLLATIVLGTSVLVNSTLSKVNETIKNPIDSPVLEILDDNKYINSDDGKKVFNLGAANKDNKIFFDDLIKDVNDEFVNPTIINDYADARGSKIILEDLSDAINSTDVDADKDFIDLIQKNNEIKALKRESNRVSLLDPIDSISLSNASDFGMDDELKARIYGSIDNEIWNIDWNEDYVDKIVTPGTYQNPDFQKQKKSWWSGDSIKLSKIKDGILSFATHALETFAVALAAFEIGFFIFDLLQETHTQNFYEYVTADGTKFYWDGGMSVSKFMGFINEDVTTIADMQLVKPVQITLPQIEEFYYYDQTKYYDGSELKRKILLDYLNNKNIPKNTKFKISYYLNDKSININNNSLEKLIQSIETDLKIKPLDSGSYNFNELNKTSVYLSGLSVSYDFGYQFDSTDNNLTLIENITKNIRLSNIAVLPDLENNFAIGSISTEFSFPGKYYDGEKVVVNETNKNILANNSANDLKADFIGPIIDQTSFVNTDAENAVKQSEQALYEQFKNSFSLKAKQVLNISYTTNKFSELPKEIQKRKLYNVKNPITNEILHFIELNQAITYLNDVLKFNKKTDNAKTYYYFDNKKFNSYQDLINWVNSNVEKNSF